MNSFILEIFDADFPLVTFYTVRWENEDLSETDKFFQRFLENEIYQEDLDEINFLLEFMGNEECALSAFFTRHEDEANALPPGKVYEYSLSYENNSLRLYCTRINNHTVVLFNGGVKSARTAQESDDLASKFRNAKFFARKIWEYIHNKTLVVDEPYHALRMFDDSEEIIIY